MFAKCAVVPSVVAADQSGARIPPEVQLLSPEDVAKALVTSRAFVYAAIRTGRIKVVRVGRLPRVTLESLRQFIADAGTAAEKGGAGV